MRTSSQADILVCNVSPRKANVPYFLKSKQSQNSVREIKGSLDVDVSHFFPSRFAGATNFTLAKVWPAYPMGCASWPDHPGSSFCAGL